MALLGTAALFTLHGCSGRNDGDTATLTDAVTPALIEKGQYLARAANCAACHTTAEGAAFAGGVVFETPFGKVYSANITPDAATGIGTWTVQQFARSLRHGIRPDGQRLYPVFPYTAFTKITGEDAA